MLTKSHIRKIAIEELTWRGCEVWPQNNARVTRGRTFVGRKGVSDIIGWSRMGLFVGCEVKAIGDRLSDDQHKWLSELERAGGLALIACEEDGRVVLVEYSKFKK